MQRMLMSFVGCLAMVAVTACHNPDWDFKSCPQIGEALSQRADECLPEVQASFSVVEIRAPSCDGGMTSGSVRVIAMGWRYRARDPLGSSDLRRVDC